MSKALLDATSASNALHAPSETDGNTALHHAILNNKDDDAESLIEKGANFDIPNKDAKTALALAKAAHKHHIVALCLFKKLEKEDKNENAQAKPNKLLAELLVELVNTINAIQNPEKQQSLSFSLSAYMLLKHGGDDSSSSASKVKRKSQLIN